MAYDWSADSDGTLTCLNAKDTCQGDLCRLDIQFSGELFKIKNSWQKTLHLKNGFDRMATCAPKTSPKTTNTRSTGGHTTVASECCGNGIQRSIYKPDRQECCKDGSVRRMGAC